MTKKVLKPEKSTKVDKQINPLERHYIYENLKYFIEKEAVYERTSCELHGWTITVDSQTRLRYRLLDYILEHFTLFELYMIFHRYQSNYCPELYDNEAFREKAIFDINENESLSPEEKKQLKRKIWNTNLILFGLILELIIESELFGDVEEAEVVYPDYAASGFLNFNN